MSKIYRYKNYLENFYDENHKNMSVIKQPITQVTKLKLSIILTN